MGKASRCENFLERTDSSPLTSGKIGMIIAGELTAERKKKSPFSNSYYTSRYIYAGSKRLATA